MRRLAFATFRDDDVLDTERLDRYFADIAAVLNGGLDASHFDPSLVFANTMHASDYGLTALVRQLRYTYPQTPWDETLPHVEPLGVAGPLWIIGMSVIMARSSGLNETLQLLADGSALNSVLVSSSTSPGSDDTIVIHKPLNHIRASPTVLDLRQNTYVGGLLEGALVTITCATDWET